MKRIVAIFLFGGWSALAQTNQTVFPLGFDNKFGADADPAFIGSAEYQEIFRSSSLTPAWKMPVLITDMAFRWNEGLSSFSVVVPRIELRFSTSARAPEQMSLFWSDNRGPDESVVYLHDNVPLFGVAGRPPSAFDLSLHLDQPFVYDPSEGNLAFYLKTTGAIGGRTIDAQAYTSFAASPAASITANASGTFVPYSLITRFTWTAVPEPCLEALFFVGLCLLAPTTFRKLNQRG